MENFTELQEIISLITICTLGLLILLIVASWIPHFLERRAIEDLARQRKKLAGLHEEEHKKYNLREIR